MAAMNTWQRGPMPQQPQAPPPSGGGDTNEAGAAFDPFGYTQGSLLTPWQGRFDSSSYGGGGYSAPEFTPFNYADFGYNAPSAGRFTENYADPAAFRFADFAGPSGFKAPTAEAMKADPGYQARMDAVKNAQVAGAAHGGVLRGGGFQKGLAKAVGDQASQEYGNVYNRAAAEYGQKFAQAKDVYGINQGNTKSAFDTNTQNRLAAHQTRQNDWSGNANVALQEGQLGYNIAQGTWDRNMAKARQGYDDQAAHNAAVASAASANANQAYNRDLDDYMRSRDEFWTNQDRQYALLDREDTKDRNAMSDYAQLMMGGYGRQADYETGIGDVQASGRIGQGNASAGGWQGAGDAISGVLQYGAANGGYGQPKPPPGQPPRPGPAPRIPSVGVTAGIPGGRLPGVDVGMPQGRGRYSGMPPVSPYSNA